VSFDKPSLDQLQHERARKSVSFGTGWRERKDEFGKTLIFVGDSRPRPLDLAKDVLVIAGRLRNLLTDGCPRIRQPDLSVLFRAGADQGCWVNVRDLLRKGSTCRDIRTVILARAPRRALSCLRK